MDGEKERTEETTIVTNRMISPRRQANVSILAMETGTGSGSGSGSGTNVTYAKTLYV